jgi:hypothetical protein
MYSRGSNSWAVCDWGETCEEFADLPEADAPSDKME